nr:restriction endonuclease subunit S [Nitrosomonas nitrosa]
MTDGWRTVKLGDVCALDKQSYGGSSLPYIGMEDVDSGGTGRFFGSREAQTVKSNTFQFGPQHLLYGRLRPYLNKVLLPDFEGHCSTEIFPVLCKDGLDRNFLFYWLTSASVVEKINKTCTGARMPRANFKEVLKFNFPLPSLEEQKRIVVILDEAFEGIEKAQANAEQNLANARELFESYMNVIFTQQGEGWEEKRLEDIAYLAGRIGWKGLTAKEYTKKGPLFISVHSLNYGDYVDFRDANHITQERYDESPEIMLQPDDVLICKDGAGIGKMGIVKELPGPTTINSSLLLIRSLDGMHPKYLYRALCSQIFQKLVKEKIDGATTPHLYQREIKQFLVPVPPVEEQKKISDRLDSIGSETARLETIYQQKLKDLAELKQSLLKKAFSGELTSSNVVVFTRPVSEQQTVATSSPEFAANVLAYAHNWHASQQRDRTFGRVKAQKVLHMAESVAGVDMGRQPIKDAAGPNDFQHMLRAEDWARSNLFFEFTPRLTGNGYDFKKLGDYNKLIGGALETVKPYKDKLDKILALMMPLNTREAEVLATVHAAWNNLVLDSAEVTDDKIHEACKTWHERKQPITEVEFRKAITTIRNNGIVPDGTAKRVIGQESLPL